MVLLLACGWSAHAQKVAVKTNLLYGAGTDRKSTRLNSSH